MIEDRLNDEMKEILGKLKETADYPKLNYSSYDKSYNETIDNVAMIKSFACKQLLDYITNLQQENESWRRVATKNFNDAEDYKSRNDKAKEKLKSVSLYGLRSGKTLISALINDVLDILEGDDENE